MARVKRQKIKDYITTTEQQLENCCKIGTDVYERLAILNRMMNDPETAEVAKEMYDFFCSVATERRAYYYSYLKHTRATLGYIDYASLASDTENLAYYLGSINFAINYVHDWRCKMEKQMAAEEVEE